MWVAAFRFRRSPSTRSDTTNTISQVQYLDTGTILKVRPRISKDGMVFLDIVQEISSPVGQPDQNGNVRIDTRKLKTEAAVQNGDTVMLAGLIDDGVSRGASGFPGLSRIPVIGGLFGRQTSRTQRNETIVLITPTIIRNPQEARDLTDEYGRVSARWNRCNASRAIRASSARPITADSDLPIVQLPIVILPVGVDDEALDACLAALDASTPAGTRVWLADDAQVGPRGHAIIQHWIARTALRRRLHAPSAQHRRSRASGRSAGRLRRCRCRRARERCCAAARLARASRRLFAPRRSHRLGHAVEQCRRNRLLAAYRRNQSGAGRRRAPGACGRGDAGHLHPELPTAVSHAVLLRGSARKRAGGLDAASYGSWYAALIDLSLRFSGLGLAQRAVRYRLRRARGRRPAARWRSRRDRRALAGLACTRRQLPDGRSAAQNARTSCQSAGDHRPARAAARPVCLTTHAPV